MDSRATECIPMDSGRGAIVMVKLTKEILLEEIRQGELNVMKYSAVVDYCKYLLKTYDFEEDKKTEAVG